MESTQSIALAIAGHPRLRPGFHKGLPPRNRGLRYPPDPPTVEDIVAVMHAAGDSPDGLRLRGIIVVLWRAGLRISEALTLNETDLDPDRGSLLIGHGKGTYAARSEWTAGPGRTSTRGSTSEPSYRQASSSACCADRPATGHARPRGIRAQLHHASATAGVRRRFAPHQLRHAHTVEMSREGISLIVIQRQLGRADLAITSRYLRGIDNTEIIAAVHERPAPMIPADPPTRFLR